MRNLFLLLVVLLILSPASAATIYVPQDYITIQSAVDAAADGDTVMVTLGSYIGVGNRHIMIEGKSVAVISASGPQATFIDCEHEDLAFVISGAAATNSIIDGFTIVNGIGVAGPVPESAPGGAIACSDASPIIKNCLFYGNSGHPGGAIYLARSAARVINCTFVANRCREISYYTLGSAIAGFHSTASIENCLIAYNTNGTPVDEDTIFSVPGITLKCTNIFGNPDGNWVGTIAGFANMDGNFSMDPLFCDTSATDFRISDISPCAPVGNTCDKLIGCYGIGCYSMLRRGDANGDGMLNISDGLFIVNYIFAGGPAPTPRAIADLNCDDLVNISDTIYLLNYIFAGGPPPVIICR